jgi:hypothetical protein
MNEWIAMKDRKPRQGQRVIYYFDEVGMHIGKYRRTPDGGDCFSHGFCFLTNDVTHWMPVPKPPKVDGKSEVKK